MAGVSEAVSLSVTTQETMNCSIPIWYPKFKNITFKSVFIPLPRDFVKYLKSDGILLPHGCDPPYHEPETEGVTTVGESSSDDSDDSEDSFHDNQPYFPAIVEKIESAIAHLGGRVIPKLNWSAPRDAVWLLPGNTMECRTPGDVILLLKSSDFVAHDILHVFDKCDDGESRNKDSMIYTLCLRQWVELRPSSEFRCFVYNNSLLAISQREVSSCYDHLLGCRDDIRRDIIEFFQSHIIDNYPDQNYVFDVWRVSEGKIVLVDFNPYCPTTDALLFSWEELAGGCGLSGSGEAPVIRLVEDKASIRSHDLQVYRYPQDAVELARGEDVHKLVDLLRLRGKGAEESDSS